VVGCTIFAAVSGSSAATCATIGKMTLPELSRRGYPDDITDRHAGRRGHAGAADPAVDHHDRLWRHGRGLHFAPVHCRRTAGACMLAMLFSGYIALWALLNPQKVPVADRTYTFLEKLA
jgi:C4-dicarboxylate transporter DctM subunit